MNAPKQIPALTLACPRVWDSLVDQLRIAVNKAGFTDVVLGLSGGIDSALVATIAVDALGTDHVHGVLMPSPFSSEGSVTDALSLASNLGISTNLISITPLYESFITSLAPHFAGRERDITEENLHRILLRSRKPKSRSFQDWAAKEALPAIRKIGGAA